MNEKVEQSTMYRAEIANDKAAVVMKCPSCGVGQIVRTGNERAFGTIKECPNCGLKLPIDEE